MNGPPPGKPGRPPNANGLPPEGNGYLLDGLAIGYRRRTVLDGLDAAAGPGDLTVLIGPNGTGKSTLLRTLAGLQRPLAGRIRLDGTDLTSLGPGDLARRLAVVLTERDLPPLLTARELVGLGRYQHTGLTGRLTSKDNKAVDQAMAGVGAAHLADRPVTELSDGERQRVLIARALAQEPAALLLDEPTAFLDVTSRVTVLGLLRTLARDRGLTVIVSTHDLELALRIADRIWLLAPGEGLTAGTPEQLTLTGAIAAAFAGTGLAFDPAAGTFTLTGGTAGTERTATVAAEGLHRPLTERALAREGWTITEHPGADLRITWDGETITADYDRTHHTFATLTDLTGWARHVRERHE